MFAASADLTEYLWILIVGFILAFLLAFAIGANDVANSFATSVGAKVLTLRGACILATIFETSGAILLGYKVSATIRSGIFNVSLYEGQEEVLMLGELSALGGSFLWLFIATFLRLPVSTTHSIVGAMVGFHLVVFGTKGLNWRELVKIAVSWFTSPALSGAISCVLFVIIRWCIIDKEDSVKPGLISVPIFYTATIIINSFSIFYDGPPLLGFDKIPLWGAFILSFGIGFIVGILVQLIVVPRMRKKIEEECIKPKDDETVSLTSNQSPMGESTDCTQYGTIANEGQTNHANGGATAGRCNGPIPNAAHHKVDEDITQVADQMDCTTEEKGESQTLMSSSDITHLPDDKENVRGASNGHLNSQNDSLHEELTELSHEEDGKEEQKDAKEEKDRGVKTDSPEVAILFKFLQILSACFGAFAHGGNDVSNAIGPITALWFIYKDGSVSQESATPLWILLYGGVGISIGLWLWGWRVIQTVGEDLSVVTPSSGFTIELGSATTVLMASNIGVPISTTHCKIGSVVSVGWLRERRSVEWKIFGNIVIAWLVTVPAAGVVSAILMAGLRNVL